MKPNTHPTHSASLAAVLGLVVATSAYGGQIQQGLVVHLPFDGDIADTRQNVTPVAVGYGSAGVADTSTAGKIGSGALKAWTYPNPGVVPEGESQFNYITLGSPNDAGIDPGGVTTFGDSTDFSVSFWVKLGTWSGDPSFVANKDWNSGGNVGFVVATDSDARIQWNYRETNNGASRKDYDSPGGLLSGGWHHVAVTFARNQNATTYVDGAQVDSTPIVTAANGTWAPGTIDRLSLNVGQDGAGQYTDGNGTVYLDDFGLWRRVLAPDEVATIFSSGNVGVDLSRVPNPGAPPPTALIPARYAMPAGTVDKGSPGFLARPYQTSAAQPNSLLWTEQQLAGLQGPNLADLSGADAAGYYHVDTVVNWNNSSASVDGFPSASKFPGITGSENFSEEILTYIEFPSPGNYTLGVNSDDGFRVTTAFANPRDPYSAIKLGEWDGGRGSADSLFTFTVPVAGIYPFRVIYEQGGGGANVSWFSLLEDGTKVLVNDPDNEASLKAYSAASFAPPYVSAFVHDGTGFTLSLSDGATALDPAAVRVKLNGAEAPTTPAANGGVHSFTYVSPGFVPALSSNTVTVTYSDSAKPAFTTTVSIPYVEGFYAPLPSGFALGRSEVDTTAPGFRVRSSQLNSASPLAANIAHAEAQLAGLLIDPVSGAPYEETATPGEQADGSYELSNVLNFSTGSADQGNFTSANGHAEDAVPGLSGSSGNNLAVEVVTYLELSKGFHRFGINSSDGFRVTAGRNPYDALATELAVYDARRIVRDTTFDLTVAQDGIYPVRIVWFRQANLPNNGPSTAAFEFFTVTSSGEKVLVNDGSNPASVKAYARRTSPVEPYVSYAGPSSFISDYRGSDVGFRTLEARVADGTTLKVDPASIQLSVDGAPVAITTAPGVGSITLEYVPAGLQLPRSVHTASLSFADKAGARHSASWRFNGLRNYELPEPLFFEDFESTDAGPDPMVPAGWVQENYTGHEHLTTEPGDGNSEFYLGFVVIDKPMRGKKNGTSSAAVQMINGVTFDEATNPLMNGHCIYAESDDRQNGPPGQIQYLYTPHYNLAGKSGVVIAFNSAYEQNQDGLNGMEYSVDGGASWNPIFYWIQGDDDTQGTPDILRGPDGKVDAVATLTKTYGDVARYTDGTGTLVGGYYGFFLKAPITPALAPFIEGRINDDGSESKRVEVAQVPLADNKSDVQFRFIQSGTSSWYWGIDNWGVYSVPSLVPPASGAIKATLAGGKVQLTWTGAGTLESATELAGPWTPVTGVTGTTATVDPSAAHRFFRIR
ncbi:MAG TPA: hypothetical protein DCM86_08460 [Verrucomicrobiales bacterium]|nr:hypothetical protein [Verrucomicrobiales bacterium]